MSATYPLAVKTFTQKRNLLEDVDASHVNDLQDEVRAIQNVLGIRPNFDPNTGTEFSTVSDRIAAAQKRTTPGGSPVFDYWQTGTIYAPSTTHDSIWTRITLSDAVTDTDGLYDGAGLKVAKRALYSLTASAEFFSSGIRGVRHVGIWSGEVVAGKLLGSVIHWGSFPVPTTSYSDGMATCTWTGVLNPPGLIRVAVLCDRQGGPDLGNIPVGRARLQGHLIREV